MKTLIVFNHPYNGSYCNAILNSVMKGLQRAGHEIDLIHLDEDNFNPVMSKEDLKGFRNREPIDPKVLEYKNRLEKANNLIFIFPIWWGLMPAMTKGFIDKVMFPGVAYDHVPNGLGMKPLLKNLKTVRIITTMNTPGILYKLMLGNAIGKTLIKGTFKQMGYKDSKLITLSMVKFVSKEKREKWLHQLENKFSKF